MAGRMPEGRDQHADHPWTTAGYPAAPPPATRGSIPRKLDAGTGMDKSSKQQIVNAEDQVGNSARSMTKPKVVPAFEMWLTSYRRKPEQVSNAVRIPGPKSPTDNS